MKETPLLLRWRKHPTFWQRVQARVQTFWHRLWTPRIVVQPPLQPTRHRPFPQRPHHRRRQAVFAALATAPADATIHELITHVRTITGTGCSRKLIVAWRQEVESGRVGEREMGRVGDAATRGQGDAGMKAKRSTTRRWRCEQLRLFLVCVLLGATLQPLPPARSVAAQEITISPAPSTSPTISNRQSPISNSSSPRLLRIRLTIHAPHELRIKTGDEVKVGDILSDRRQARARLLVQQRALQSAQRHLQQQRELNQASLQQLQSLGPELPAITFAAERAAIQRAETDALAVNRAVEIQQQKLEVVGGRWSVIGQESSTSLAPTLEGEATAAISRPPATDHRPLTPEQRALIQEHEAARLTLANDKQLLAHSEIALHQAKLITAKEVRAWEEQKHRVEVARQILSVRIQQQQIEIELARLTAQLAELDLQLANLAAIRAPFAGTIKRLEWEDMNDETITVLVYLSLGSR